MFDDKNEYSSKLRQLVRKRLSAEKRIGVNYQIKYTTLGPEQLQQLTEPKQRSKKTS